MLGLSKRGLYGCLAWSAKPGTDIAGKRGAHECVAPGGPAAARSFMLAGIGRDQDLGANVHDVVDPLPMPAAAVRERDPRRVVRIGLV